MPNTSARLSGKSRRKYIRWGIISGNCLLLLSVAAFLVFNRSASQTVRNSTAASAVATARSIPSPIDQLSSAQIALQAAQMTELPETTAVRMQADSEFATLNFVPTDSTTAVKPQIVSTNLKSKFDITRYTVQQGDTIDSVAAKFKVTVGSITGSNNSAGNLKPGTVIVVPPANGIVYKVQSGDTIDKIINKYGADRDLTIQVNDAEAGIKPGEYIWIPNVSQPNVVGARGVRSGGVVRGFVPTFGYNGYDYGYCTWYVASKIRVPSNWGNANTWDNYARRTPGWTVTTVPSVGAIAQTDRGGLGHVAIVTAVSPDGSQIKYSDMNGIAGWGRVGYSDWVPVSKYPHYIIPQ